MEITHEKYITILNEKDKYERINDNLRSESEKYVSKDTIYKATHKTRLKIIECIF